MVSKKKAGTHTWLREAHLCPKSDTHQIPSKALSNLDKMSSESRNHPFGRKAKRKTISLMIKIATFP